MTTLVLVFDDGRLDYLDRSLASFRENVHGDRFRFLIHQDEPTAVRATRDRYPDCEVIGGAKRSGFAGAIGRAWQAAATPRFNDCDWVFHLEGDFTFNRQVNLQQLQLVLETRPHLVHMALRRQPWNPAEVEAGGVVELNPTAYEQHTNAFGWSWLEHRLFFTTNPSLYRRDLVRSHWPTSPQSEGLFTIQLLEFGPPWGGPAGPLRFGYWGHRDDPPWVEHIGAVRAGKGY